MLHINSINITKRCGYKPTDIIYNFLTEISDEMFQQKMRQVISWKNESNLYLKEAGEQAELLYTPYLNSKIKDIPEYILNRYSRRWYTDGEKYYIYSPCCI